MLFAILCTDRPDTLDLRQATRGAHLGYLAGHAERLVHAGPLLGSDGAPCGSLLVVDMADRAAAERFAADDPYAVAGLFGSVLVHGHRLVFRDGAQIG